MHTMRWLLVGAGDIATRRVGPALVNTDRSELVAICDTKRERAQALAEQLGVQAVYDEYASALTESGADAVYIATPQNTHIELSLAALDAGKHLLCEKPLGKKPVLCPVPAHDLGFELGGDFGEKLISFSNNGVYDSSKIRALVPEFICTTHFAEGVRRTIQFYRDNPEFQVVHEEFDRRMDEIAEAYHA